MRDFITIVEGSAPGKLFQSDDGSAVGYWYHPRTGDYHVIAWEQADGVDSFSDHCDVALDHPDWFGLDPEYEFGDCDEARVQVILNGWVRIGYNDYDKIARFDGSNPSVILRAYRWFVAGHPNISAISVGLVTGDDWKSFVIRGEDITEYESNGRLQAAWAI